MDDNNFEQVMKTSDVVARSVYREEAKQIEELRKRIIEVSNKEDPYDIFICFKEKDEKGHRTIDCLIAEGVYHALEEKGYKVFFSHITLKDKLGKEFEPYIFSALNSAKVMLAFGTNREYYNSVWVKNEWSRFLQLIAKGEKKTLIPCYKNIDVHDLPEEFSHLQAQDMGEVGATQDLLRGIEKVIDPDKKNKAGAQQAVANGPTEKSLLKRGFISIEQSEWRDANKFFEDVLNINPENAEAYRGKLMADLNANNWEMVKNTNHRIDENRNYRLAMKFGNSEIKQQLSDASNQINTRLDQQEQQREEERRQRKKEEEERSRQEKERQRQLIEERRRQEEAERQRQEEERQRQEEERQRQEEENRRQEEKKWKRLSITHLVLTAIFGLIDVFLLVFCFALDSGFTKEKLLPIYIFFNSLLLIYGIVSRLLSNGCKNFSYDRRNGSQKISKRTRIALCLMFLLNCAIPVFQEFGKSGNIQWATIAGALILFVPGWIIGFLIAKRSEGATTIFWIISVLRILSDYFVYANGASSDGIPFFIPDYLETSFNGTIPTIYLVITIFVVPIAYAFVSAALSNDSHDNDSLIFGSAIAVTILCFSMILGICIMEGVNTEVFLMSVIPTAISIFILFKRRD